MGGATSVMTEEREAFLKDPAREQDAVGRAAAAIAQADVLLLCTGAGWSADSGLKVYQDIADIGAYHDKGLTYRDICCPSYLHDDPETFYGFWGACFNDYRNATPHAGYGIVARWREQLFAAGAARQTRTDSRGGAAASLSALVGVSEEKDRERARNRAVEDKARAACQVAGSGAAGARSMEECHVEAEAAEPFTAVVSNPLADVSAFFSFTSNVDAHHLQSFPAGEVHECHGNSETWQCATRGACDRTWAAPAGFRFDVDSTTMRAAPGRGGDHAHDGDSVELASSWGNHPRCVRCGGPARPNILMFEDRAYKHDEASVSRFSSWATAVEEHVERETAAGRRCRVVVLEIGAGDNVRTVRQTSETLLRDVVGAGGVPTLIRINPDLPLADDRDLQAHTLSLMARGLTSVKRIDAALQLLLAGGDEACFGADSTPPTLPAVPAAEQAEHQRMRDGPRFAEQPSFAAAPPAAPVFARGHGHGRGVTTFPNGDKYDGEFQAGERHGRGVYAYANGNTYDGEFQAGVAHGRGVMAQPGEWQYDGEWQAAKQHGHGLMTFADGRPWLAGQWRHGVFLG